MFACLVALRLRGYDPPSREKKYNEALCLPTVFPLQSRKLPSKNKIHHNITTTTNYSVKFFLAQFWQLLSPPKNPNTLYIILIFLRELIYLLKYLL